MKFYINVMDTDDGKRAYFKRMGYEVIRRGPCKGQFLTPEVLAKLETLRKTVGFFT